MTDSIYCLAIIIAKDDNNIAAVQFEIKHLDFFYWSKRLTDYIYTDIYCKLWKCIGQTSCSYEHYLVCQAITQLESFFVCGGCCTSHYRFELCKRSPYNLLNLLDANECEM